MNDKECAKVLIEFLFSNDVSRGCSSVELMFWIIATVLVKLTVHYSGFQVNHCIYTLCGVCIKTTCVMC